MTECVAITSGKGGVGKTSTAINIVAALTQYGRHAVVVDVDVTTPNVGLYLGSATTQHTIHDVLKGTKKLSEATYTHVSGVHFVAGSIKTDDYPSSLHALKNVLQDLQGKTEMILLDTASGIGAETLAAIKAAQSILVVVTPDMLSITDALKTIHTARLHNIPTKGIIINRARGEAEEVSQETIQALLEAPILGVVPEDKTMRFALKIKYPVVHSDPEAPAAHAYKQIACTLIGHCTQETKEHKYWNNILRFIKLR